MNNAINFIDYIDDNKKKNYEIDEENFTFLYKNDDIFKEEVEKIKKLKDKYFPADTPLLTDPYKISHNFIRYKFNKSLFVYFDYGTPINWFYFYNFPKITYELKQEYDDL